MRSVKSGVRSYHNHMSRNKVLLVFAAVLIFFNIIVFNDSCFYSQPICRIVSIETTQQPDVVGDLGTSESAYRQKLVCKAINGTQHDVDAASTTSRMTASTDNTFTIENDYTFSRYNDTKYHKGDYLFLREVKTDNAGNITSAVIDGQKRLFSFDTFERCDIWGGADSRRKRRCICHGACGKYRSSGSRLCMLSGRSQLHLCNSSISCHIPFYFPDALYWKK